MAAPTAIASVSSTLARLLATADADAQQPVRIVRSADDVTSAPTTSGFGLFLYRITPSTERRANGHRVVADGTLHAPTAYADLYYLVTAWAADGAEQHRLLGTAIRAIEDQTVLDAGSLKATANDPVFAAGEAVEVIWEVGRTAGARQHLDDRAEGVPRRCRLCGPRRADRLDAHRRCRQRGDRTRLRLRGCRHAVSTLPALAVTS